MYNEEQAKRYIHLRYVLRLTASKHEADQYFKEPIPNGVTIIATILKECGLTCEDSDLIGRDYQTEIAKIDGLHESSYKSNQERKDGFKTFENFYNWHQKQWQEQGNKCYYCGVNGNDLNHLFEIGVLGRRVNRGYVLEIDRKNPYHPYNAGNCVFACYLCNNDKSNVLTDAQYITSGIPQARRTYIQTLVIESRIESLLYSRIHPV